MILNDVMLLAISKLKARKQRTAATVVSISVLFGVVITAFFIIAGIRSGIENAAKIQFGETVYLEISQDFAGWGNQALLARAIELYKTSSDPDKAYPVITINNYGQLLDEPYLDDNNIFAQAAIEEHQLAMQQEVENSLADKIKDYDATILTIQEFFIRGDTLRIGENYGLKETGQNLLLADQKFITSIIEVDQLNESALPIIVPADIAGQIVGLGQPSRLYSTIQQLNSYIKEVREKSIGHTYVATMMSQNEEVSIKYQIVGLTPPFGSMQLAKTAGEFQILDLLLGNLGAYKTPFILADPTSEIFKQHYTPTSANSISASFLVEFTNINDAVSFQKKYSCSASENHCSDFFISEFANNRVNNHEIFSIADILLAIFATFFSVVAAIIMFATISRVIDDERQSIALYRAEGASTANIVQIYTGYIFALCLMTCAAALVIGLTLSYISSVLISPDLTIIVKLFYNITDDINVTLLAFDPRIFLIFATIFVIGALSILLMINKITSKNVIEDLKS